MLPHLLSPPNWFTAASILCSVSALGLLSMPGVPSPEDFVRAAILVVFGGVFDALDGRVARLTRRESAFGVQLDSLADFLGFGVAPALLAHTWKLHALGVGGSLIAVAYVLAAAFRLARFNVAAHERADDWPFPGHSEGLTSTMSGGILVTYVWIAHDYLADTLDPTPGALGGLTLLLAYLMISGVPFRSFKDLRRNPRARRLLSAALLACLASAILMDPSMWFGTGATLYLTAGLADGLLVAARAGRVGPAILLGTLDPLESDVELDDAYAEALDAPGPDGADETFAASGPSDPTDPADVVSRTPSAT